VEVPKKLLLWLSRAVAIVDEGVVTEASSPTFDAAS
jgi:hypothetical protein